MYESKLYNVKRGRGKILTSKIEINIPKSDKDIKSVIDTLDPVNNLSSFIYKIIIRGRQDILVSLLEGELCDRISELYIPLLLSYRIKNRIDIDISDDIVINSPNFKLFKLYNGIGITNDMMESNDNSRLIMDCFQSDNILHKTFAMRMIYSLLIKCYPDEETYKHILDAYHMEAITEESITRDIIYTFSIKDGNINSPKVITFLSNVLYFLERGEKHTSLQMLMGYIAKNHKNLIKDTHYKVQNDKISFDNCELEGEVVTIKEIVITFENINVINWYLKRCEPLVNIIKNTNLQSSLAYLLNNKKYSTIIKLLDNDKKKWNVMTTLLVGYNIHKNVKETDDLKIFFELINNSNIFIEDNIIIPKNISPEFTLNFSYDLVYRCFSCKYSKPEILAYNVLRVLTSIFCSNEVYSQYMEDLVGYGSSFNVNFLSEPIKTIDCYRELKKLFYRENLNLEITKFASLIRLLVIDFFSLKTDTSKFTCLYDYYCDVSYMLEGNSFLTIKSMLANHRS